MIQIKYIGGFSKQGKRDNNEDYILYSEVNNPNSRFIILCDGMGGHGHGEIASQTVGNVFLGYLKSLEKEEYEETDFQDALNAALSALEEADIYDDEKTMGTTLVAVVVNKMNILVGHVGDSRCYLFDENGIKKYRTKDHSKVAEAIEAEIMTEDEAFTSTYKNILTRCVMSGKKDVIIDVDTLQIEDNDRLFLCTDGVNDAMRDKEIEECMMERSAKDTLDLIDNICSDKSHDNYSAIIVDFSQDEKNPDSTISVESIEECGVENGKQIRCNYCGEANEPTAHFCKNCGIELINDMPDDLLEQESTNKVKTRMDMVLKRWTPFLCFLLGILLSISYYTISSCFKEKEIKEKIAEKQTFDMYNYQTFKNASMTLIADLCSVDTTNGVADTMLHKDTLRHIYIEFCNHYKSRK